MAANHIGDIEVPICTTEYKYPSPGVGNLDKIATSWEHFIERIFGTEFHHFANDE